MRSEVRSRRRFLSQKTILKECMEVSACHVMFVDVDDVMLVPSVITHRNRGFNCQKEVREAPLLIPQHTAAGQKQIAALLWMQKKSL